MRELVHLLLAAHALTPKNLGCHHARTQSELGIFPAKTRVLKTRYLLAKSSRCRGPQFGGAKLKNCPPALG
jgi:hypothetical protein